MIKPALLLACLLMASPAYGQMLCGERDKVIAGLMQGYREAITSMGLTSGGAVIEVLTSERGTFTIIVTRPDGLSCLVASGESWQELPKAWGPLEEDEI